MFPKATTLLILTAILVQGVFGGLQNSVSICLGGGHTHEVSEVVEHCMLECSHRGEWPTPITNSEDIDNCECTDLEFGLITLLTSLRNGDDVPVIAESAFINTTLYLVEEQAQVSWRGPPSNTDNDPAKQHRLVVVRSTRLQL